MRPKQGIPPSLSDVRDQFLVQYCTVDATIKEVSKETFQGLGGRKAKLIKLQMVRHHHWAGREVTAAKNATPVAPATPARSSLLEPLVVEARCITLRKFQATPLCESRISPRA